MSELGKSFLQKRQKNRKSVSKCRMCAKNHYREMKFWFKQKTRRRMNIGTLENHLEKNSVKKLKKTVKCKVKLPYVNKKTTNEKKNFCVQTSFSHSTVKLERKNFTPQNHSLFRSNSCFGVTKITTPN